MADLKIVLTVVDKDTGKVQTLRRGLADLANDAGGADAKVGGLSGRIGGLASSLGGMIGPLAAGYLGLQGLMKVAGGIGDAIGAASAMNETVNKSSVVFGAGAKAVEAFGATAAQSIGQSKEQAIAAAATFGNLFEATGMGQAQAAGLSVELVKLASDLASFNNTAPAEALEALRSGMVGMVEPLRRYGVNLIETNVAAKAVEMGLGGVGGALSDNDKMMARYALILDQTKNAQGDFARTADQAANSERILTAQTSDLSARFGTLLLPLKTDLVHALSATVTGMEGVGTTVGNLNRTIKDHSTEISILAGVVAALGSRYLATAGIAVGYAIVMQGVAVATGAAAAAQWALNAAMAANPLALVAMGLIGVATAGAVAYATNDQFAASVDNAMGSTVGLTSSLGQIHPELKAFSDEMLSAHGTAVGYAGGIDGISVALGGYLGLAVAASNTPLDYVFNVGGAAAWKATSAINGISDALGRYLSLLPAVTNAPIVGVEPYSPAVPSAVPDDVGPITRAVNSAATIQVIQDEMAARAKAARDAETAGNKAVSAAKSQASAAESVASKAASDAETAKNKAIADAAKEATAAVRDLTSAYNDLAKAPVLGSKAFGDKEFDLQQQLDAIDYRMAELSGQKGNRTELRTLTKQRATIAKDLSQTQLGEKILLGPERRTIEEAANPPLPERDWQSIVAGIPPMKTAITGAGTAQEQDNSALATAIATAGMAVQNNITVTVPPGTDSDLASRVAAAVKAALATITKGAGTTGIGANPQLAGAR